MRATQPKRSMLVKIIALIFLAWGGFVLWGLVVSRAWDPGSFFWMHSDALWVREYIDVQPTLESQRLMAAQFRAQMRYELPIKGTSIAWSLATFVASLGLLRRKNWARLLFIGAMASAVLGVAWGIALFTRLRMVDTADLVECVVIVVALGSIAWKLRSPSIVGEFRNPRS
jgi:hypothetical protein